MSVFLFVCCIVSFVLCNFLSCVCSGVYFSDKRRHRTYFVAPQIVITVVIPPAAGYAWVGYLRQGPQRCKRPRAAVLPNFFAFPHWRVFPLFLPKIIASAASPQFCGLVWLESRPPWAGISQAVD